MKKLNLLKPNLEKKYLEGGRGEKVTIFQTGDVQVVAATMGEGFGLTGLARLDGTVVQPAAQGVHIQLFAKDDQSHSAQHKDTGQHEGQQAHDKIRFLGRRIGAVGLFHTYAPICAASTAG